MFLPRVRSRVCVGVVRTRVRRRVRRRERRRERACRVCAWWYAPCAVPLRCAHADMAVAEGTRVHVHMLKLLPPLQFPVLFSMPNRRFISSDADTDMHVP